MAAELLLLAVLPCLLALAAGWDFASLTIPNTLSLAILLAFAAFTIAAPLPPQIVMTHLFAGLLGLLIGFALFATGFIGGGDAKLFACTLVWVGLSSALPYALVASVFGGALAIAFVCLRALPLPDLLMRHAWIARLHSPKGGLPYGVALALGGVAVIPYTDVFRLVAAL